MSKTSVIIITYHTGAILWRAIDNALKQVDLEEIIIVNNGNSDSVIEQLQELESSNQKVKLLDGHGNIGFAKGCNLAAKQVKGEYVLILNPDCLLQKDSLKIAVKEMQKHPEAYLAGFQMIHSDGSLQGGSKRNLLTPKIALYQIVKLYKFGFPSINMAEDINANESEYVPAISGACIFMKNTRYQEIGGLDERFFFHVEDLDLCMEIAKRDGKILFIPQIKPIHFRGSSDTTSYFVEKNKAEGFLKYFRKYKKDIRPFFLYYFIILGIYLRLWSKAIPLFLKKRGDKKRKNARRIRLKRQIAFLNAKTPKELINDNIKVSEPFIIAGSTGQVGLAVLKRAIANNAQTYAFYNREIMDYSHKNLTWIRGNLEKSDMDLEGVTAKTLVHSPSIWYLPQNIDKFAGIGVKHIICFSSTSVEGKATSKNPYEIELVQKFKNAEEKVAEKCDKLGIKYTIIRPTMIYGAGLDRNVSSIVRVIQRIGFFPVAYPAKGMRQPVHIEDLASAVMNSLNNPNSYGKIYNICGGERLSYFEMVNRISETIGKKKRAVRIITLPFFLDIISFITRSTDVNGEIAKRMNQDLTFDDKSAREDINHAPAKFLGNGLKDLGL